MKNKIIFTIFLSFLISYLSNAQEKTYIKYESSKIYGGEWLGDSTDQYKIRAFFVENIYGFPFKSRYFVAWRPLTTVEELPLSQISNYNIITIDQLRDIMQPMTNLQRLEYLRNRYLYIVETNTTTQKMIITGVILDPTPYPTIED